MAKRKSQYDDDRDYERGGRGDDRRGGNGRGGGGGRDGGDFNEMLQEAQNLQQDGRIDEAIELCEELVATVGRPEARYYLAWMYQEEHIWDGAIEHYTALLDDLDYALSCYYALGQCYRAKGDLKTAVHYFDEAVDRVNLDALNREESDQLIQLCHEAARTHDDLGNAEGSETVYSALLGFLRSRGWQDKVSEVERLMAQRRPGMPQAAARSNPGVPLGQPIAPSAAALGSVSRSGFLQEGPNLGVPNGMTPAYMPPTAAMPPNLTGAPGLAMNGATSANAALPGLGRMGSTPPPLPEPQRTQVMHAMRDVEAYISHGLYTAAIEECLRIIEIAPQFLDVHQALAEIYVQQGKVDQAITKYAILIDTFLVNGRIDDAITAYRRILQLEPNNLTYRVRLINLLAQHGRTEDMLRERIAAADAYLRLGYPDRAIEQFEQAIVAAPGNTELRQNYALALVRAGRVNQGISELQRILQTDPHNTIALARWNIALCSGAGTLSSNGGLANSAISAINMNDSNTRPAALELLGRLVRALRGEKLHNYDAVLREYITNVEASPSNGDLRFGLAVVYHAAKRGQEAVQNYQAAMNTPGLEIISHVGAGMALLSMSDATAGTAAVRELEEASALVRRIPLSPLVWGNRPRLDGEEAFAPDVEISQILARAYQRSNPNAMPNFGTSRPGLASGSISQPNGGRGMGGFADETYRAIADIAARHPNDAAGTLQEMVQLVKQYRSQRQFEQALVVLTEISRVAPADASVRVEIADIHIARGLLDEGIEELRRVIEIYMRQGQVNEAAQVFQQIGEIQWQMDQKDVAMATLKQVLNLTPDDMGARMLYVQYCLELGMRKEAAEQQTVLARYYYHSRQTKEAVAMLQQLIALDKDNFEAYDLLGQTYFSVGEYDQAQRVYRHLAKINPNSTIARERLAQIQEMRARR